MNQRGHPIGGVAALPTAPVPPQFARVLMNLCLMYIGSVDCRRMLRGYRTWQRSVAINPALAEAA